MDLTIQKIEPEEFPSLPALREATFETEGERLTLGETIFSLFGRKSGGIGTERLRRAVLISWPEWQNRFPVSVPAITILETAWGLGGGALAPFTLAIHLRDTYDKPAADYLKSVLGWDPQPTGLSYIRKQFAEFADPLQSYVVDQVVHELGHVYFLHGILSLKDEAEAWFGLGLGLVYDRLIWSKIANQPSPVFESFRKNWQERFAMNPEIDQRLINPRTENDGKFGLVRLQSYGHAKALAFLAELRNRLGPPRFDEYVSAYLRKPFDSELRYEDFLSLLDAEDRAMVRTVEAGFNVR